MAVAKSGVGRASGVSQLGSPVQMGLCSVWVPNDPGKFSNIRTLQFAHLLSGNNSWSCGPPCKAPDTLPGVDRASGGWVCARTALPGMVVVEGCPVSSFPGAAITTGCLKTTDMYFSQFWRPHVHNQSVGRALGENLRLPLVARAAVRVLGWAASLRLRLRGPVASSSPPCAPV